MIKLIKIKKIKNKYNLFINVRGLSVSFFSNNNNKSHIYNILATLASISFFVDICKLKKDIFLDFKVPGGRGDIYNLKLRNKKIFLIDETYNSNPYHLKQR